MAADRLLADGKDTAAVCRELGVCGATYHRWRNQFGGLKAEDAKRLKELRMSAKMPRSSGCWLMLSWRRSRSRRSRGKLLGLDRRLRPFVTSSACWGSVNGSPAA